MGYHNLLLGCLVVVELIMVLLFRYWPVSTAEHTFHFTEEQYQPITMDMVISTHQDEGAPPAVPAIPVVVPNDQIIADPLTHLQTDNLLKGKLPGPGTGGSGEGTGSGNGNGIVSNPDRQPAVVKIVEPAIPKEARKAGIKAEIWVDFLVGMTGIPEQVSIARIRIYNKDNKQWQDVSTVGYGLIDATLEAAAQWRFRPASKEGQKVRAYTRHIFTFGT